MSKTVIVTGASSGIGFKIAETLHAKGMHVIGCSRSFPKETYAWQHEICDVSKEASMVAFHKKISHDVSKVDALIHAAGMGIAGAIEDTSYHVALKQHVVNTLGPMLLTQLFLPLLRESQKGKIIMIGSVAGDITIPFQAFYSMSKRALESFTEALRYEIKPFKVQASIINPGDTKTAFATNRKIETTEKSLYYDRAKRSIDKMTQDELSGVDPMKVVNCVVKQLKRKRMKRKITVGFKYKVFVLLNTLLPTRIKERLIYRLYAK